MKTSGFKDNRLKENDEYYQKEINALNVFNKEYLKDASLIVFGQKSGDFLYPNDYLSDREERIVLSVIQWLGTPVGQGYLKTAFEEKHK